MQSQLADALGLSHPPIAILLTDTRPEGAVQFKPGRMGCVAAMLLTAAGGRPVFFDRQTFGCPGGGSALGFGDCYAEMDFPIEQLLSTGGVAQLASGQRYDMGEGERFHRNPEVTRRWLDEFPFRHIPTASWSPSDSPTPAPTSPSCSCTGTSTRTSSRHWSPWRVSSAARSRPPPHLGSRCQSIAYAYAEAERPRPRGVIGLFDISKRGQVDREIMSFTVPYVLHREMEAAVANSFLGTEVWKKLRERQ